MHANLFKPILCAGVVVYACSPTAVLAARRTLRVPPVTPTSALLPTGTAPPAAGPPYATATMPAATASVAMSSYPVAVAPTAALAAAPAPPAALAPRVGPVLPAGLDPVPPSIPAELPTTLPTGASAPQRGGGSDDAGSPGVRLASQVQPPAPVFDPNQVGNLQLRLQEAERHIRELEAPRRVFPLINLSGFMQLDHGVFSQGATSQAALGDIENGFGFRRTRLQAVGKLTDFTGYSIEMDFATVGRPSFMDVWGEQSELPLIGNLRIGQFRQPTSMDAWTSVRHLEFLERSAPFQAIDPFRRVGIMGYAMSENERTTWAYSVYGTGLTFWTGASNAYSTLGDTRFGTQIGDRQGVSFVMRGTHLLYYDDASDGRYLLHIGAGYNYSSLGGNGTTGTDARTFGSRPIPEFFVGDPTGAGLTAAGVPGVLDTGRFLANDFHYYHTELAANLGRAHFQTEFMASSVNQLGGPSVFLPGAYFQCGYFLTGESCRYLKQAGVLDYNVAPYSDFFGLGRNSRMGGLGAWELTFRWSYIDLSGSNILPGNQLAALPGPPTVPNYGVLNETTVGVNWWWNRFTRLQLNWIHAMPDYTIYGSAPFDIVATRFQIEF